MRERGGGGGGCEGGVNERRRRASKKGGGVLQRGHSARHDLHVLRANASAALSRAERAPTGQSRKGSSQGPAPIMSGGPPCGPLGGIPEPAQSGPPGGAHSSRRKSGGAPTAVAAPSGMASGAAVGSEAST